MRRIITGLIYFLSFLNVVEGSLDYPDTPQVSHVDHYFGVDVLDPYRWLENSEDFLVQDWDDAQRDCFEKHQQNNTFRDSLYKRMKQILASEKTDTFAIGFEGRLLTSYQDSDQHAPIFYVQDAPGAPLQLLLDVNTWSDEHTVEFVEPSPDGKVIAFGIAQGGDECPTVHLMNTMTLLPLEVSLKGRRQGNVSWHPDSSGFYYTANPKKGEVPSGDEYFWSTVYYHFLGTAGEKDLTVLEDKERKEWWVFLSADEDFVYIIRFRRSGLKGDIMEGYSQRWGSPTAPLQKIYHKSDGDPSYQKLVIGGQQYLLTDLEANNRRLVKWNYGIITEIIAEREELLNNVVGMNGHFAATYCQHGHSCIRIFDKKGTFIKEIPLPGPGVAFLGSAWSSSEVYVAYCSLIQPWTLYAYDFDNNSLKELSRTSIPGYNPDDYETRQEFVTSKDGTQVPVHLACRKGFSGGHALLTGYGGFNMQMDPYFSASFLPWIQSNAIACVANLRGGGEYGEQWHQAGMRENKQHVFDDFIATAEMLVREHTSPEKLAIAGGSNGGLLTGAVAMQRPELFGAVLSAVPLLDMIRYQHYRLGYLWMGEYGTSEQEEQFHHLYDYSPYHNVREGVSYPSMLITSGLNDFRVDPLHARKMAARLQFADLEGRPHLLNVEKNEGHIDHSHLCQCGRISREHGFLMQQIGLDLVMKAPVMDKSLFIWRLKQEQLREGYQEQAKYRALLRKLKAKNRNVFSLYY